MSINSYYNAKNISEILNAGVDQTAKKEVDASDVNAFTQAMNEPENQPKDLKSALIMLIQLVQLIIEALSEKKSEKEDSDSGKSPASATPTGGSIPNNQNTANRGNGDIQPVTGSGSGGGAGANEAIPAPTENVQTFNLGGKQITIGGDGTTSADEVRTTAYTIQGLYQNSSVFKEMIDKSSDPSFQITVGRRNDNTSWGHTDGRVFMNLNNIAPGNSDLFQSLLAHEFAHASIDIGHGAQIQQIEQAVARQA